MLAEDTLCYILSVMANAIALIDGFNMYHALDAKSRHCGYRYHRYKWINYWALAECFVPKSDVVLEVRWFTAEAPWAGASGQGKRNRHRELRIANQEMGVTVVDGYFRPVQKTCRLDVPRALISYGSYEEKRTDVAIAVSIVSLASAKAYDKLVLVTADSDMIPAVEAAKKMHPAGAIINVVPIERRAEALKHYVDAQIRMKEHHLIASVLPNVLQLGNGNIVRRPVSWAA